MKNDFSAKSKIADAFNKKSLQKDVDKINLIAREVSCKILNSSFGARCRENYFRTVRAELFNILKKTFGNSAIKIFDLEFATDFYAYALTGLILSYYENLSLEKKFLSDKINRLICGGVEKISA